MKTAHKIVILGLLAVSPWLSAAELSYTNLSIGFATGDTSPDGNIDIDGLDLQGSFALNNDLHVLGSVQVFDTDGDDVDRFNIGVGYHTALSHTVDFVGTVSLSDIDTGNTSSDGFQVTSGVRGLALDDFEFFADLIYEDFDDIDDDFGIAFGARYFSSQTLSFGLGFRDVSDTELIKFDVRFDF